MKKTIVLILVLIATLLVSTSLSAASKIGCVSIQSGTLTDKNGNFISVGYDQWGYNYQAMMFNGIYDNYLRPPTPVTAGNQLMMKWNDAWLSNKDCDGDGKLDRHYGYTTYRGSGAWLTNHERGTYDLNGQTCNYTYFVKIVAAPDDAVLVNGTWKTSDGVVIGPAIWNEFATVQEISNDDCKGDHGVYYKSPASPGFGFYKP